MSDLNRQLKDLKANQRQAWVLSVVSGKGGVGKSIISLNLGMKLAQMGKRVLLTEADFGLANLHVLANISPAHTWEDVYLGKCDFDKAIFSYQKNLDLLPCCSGELKLDPSKQVVSERMQERWLEIKSGYDLVIIDAGSGYALLVRKCIREADWVMLIATPEPGSIVNAYAILKLSLTEKGADLPFPNSGFGLLWNLVKSKAEAFLLKDKFDQITQRFLEFRTWDLGYMVASQLITESVKNQTPVLLSYPNSQIDSCFTHLAQKILKLSEDQKGNKKMEFISDKEINTLKKEIQGEIII